MLRKAFLSDALQRAADMGRPCVAPAARLYYIGCCVLAR